MKVFWTKFALDSLSEIYRYYKENVSVTIANNIREGILTSTNQLEKHSLSGALEELLLGLNEDHRCLIRGNYKVIYKIRNQKVYITDVFDTRQNPEKISKRNK
jgi:plasmid stabilization system protein ParE